MPRAQSLAPAHRFRFKNKLYSLDSSLIDLSLKIFPWAHFARGKAAVKLHVGLDHQGYLPAFAAITHGHTSDLALARTLTFPKGSIVACDKGYLDYAWFKTLTQKEIFFVNQAHTQRHPDLGEYGIGARTQKRLDLEVLLDPLEEQFDLPAALVDIGDRLGG